MYYATPTATLTDDGNHNGDDDDDYGGGGISGTNEDVGGIGGGIGDDNEDNQNNNQLMIFLSNSHKGKNLTFRGCVLRHMPLLLVDEFGQNKHIGHCPCILKDTNVLSLIATAPRMLV